MAEGLGNADADACTDGVRAGADTEHADSVTATANTEAAMRVSLRAITIVGYRGLL